MWGRKPKKSQDDPQNEPETRLVAHLEGLQYRADPQFRRDLKNRLLTSLEQPQAGPVRPVPSRRRWSAASSAGLALGGLGLAALLLVVVSVLSVRSNEVTVAVAPPTEVAVATVEALPSVAPVEAPPVVRSNLATTSDDEPTATAATNQTAVALSLFNPANQSYISTTTATGLVGFSVRPPAYLPTGYTLEAASVQTTTTQLDPANPEISGYYLRYSSGPSGAKPPPPALEISQWKVPFNFKPPTPSVASPSSAAPRRVSSPPVVVLGVSRARYLTIHGQSAYMIEGANWTIRIMSDGGKVNPPGRLTPGGFNYPGPPTTPYALKDQSGSPLRFGRLAADRPDYFIEFGHKTEPKNTRALVWQKDNVLNVVNAADSITQAELQKVAESF